MGKPLKVLLIEGLARQVLSMSKHLRKLGCEVTAYNTSRLDQDSDIKYPLVIKPKTGCGAIGFHISESREDALEYLLKAERKYGPCLIQGISRKMTYSINVSYSLTVMEN